MTEGHNLVFIFLSDNVWKNLNGSVVLILSVFFHETHDTKSFDFSIQFFWYTFSKQIIPHLLLICIVFCSVTKVNIILKLSPDISWRNWNHKILICLQFSPLEIYKNIMILFHHFRQMKWQINFDLFLQKIYSFSGGKDRSHIHVGKI